MLPAAPCCCLLHLHLCTLLLQAVELLMRNLLNPHPAPDALQTGRVSKALQLSRLALFELDVTISTYLNLAHAAVLGNMWRWRQPAAAVSLARYALGQQVLTIINEAIGE
jgi:hypothetical protein